MTVSTAILPDPLWCFVEFFWVYCCCAFYEYIYLCSDLTGSGNTARNEAFVIIVMVMKLWLQGACATSLRSCPCPLISSVWTQFQMLQSKNFPRVSCSLQCPHLGSQSTLSPRASTGRPRWASVGSCQRGLHSCRSRQGVQGCVVYGSPERWCCGTAQFCHTQPHEIQSALYEKKCCKGKLSIFVMRRYVAFSFINQYGVSWNRKCCVKGILLQVAWTWHLLEVNAIHIYRSINYDTLIIIKPSSFWGFFHFVFLLERPSQKGGCELRWEE